MLGDDEVDAIAIATPVSTHGLLARDALRAGKHVLVEKPLAASAAEALDLIELARRRDLVLMPGHTFLYSPPVNLVRDYIAAGELGEIFFISTSRVNLGLHQPDVSVAWDLAPHDFSILRYWLGERPTTVNAISRCCIIPSVPDIAFVNLGFPSGHDRPRRALLAGAEQAAEDNGGRLAKDGRVRRHQHRASAFVRLGCRP